MSTVFTEKPGPGSCIIQEGEDYYSRDVVSVIAGVGVTLDANAVLGKVTASGAYVLHDPAASDGSEDAAAILIYPATGTEDAAVLTRHAQVKSAMLVWKSGMTDNQKTAALASLKAAGIVSR